ncbi:MAG: FAD-dependent oxidoreductase [Candidatus Omnitrophica bacterium]|nr:FAD-dependent oxidoreductase [Candidatus Omnitrophota bacterium]
MPDSSFDFCIVGAGPSGLTAAYQLLKSGCSVVLIERQGRVGGLAKSYDYGGQIFDTGPKRFHTDDPIVLDFIQEITKGHITKIGRSTKVYFLGNYFEWPLQSKDLLKMPLGVSLKCALDLLKERPITDKSSFHQYINSKYGETLYSVFFKPYTQKFLRWDTEDIHSDWASTGINRTVIDKRIKANSLFDLFKALLLPAKVETEFLYPTEGGFGGFYEQLLGLCRDYPGFRLILSDTIVRLSDDGKQFEAQTGAGERLTFTDLIWTGNLNALSGIVATQHTHVHYLNTIFYNLICRQQGVASRQTAQWIYVSRGDSLISRLTCMKEFAPYTCGEGHYNIIAELTDSQANPVYFRDPDRHIDGILNELVKMRFLKHRKHVESVHVVPVEDTYPIYHRGYNKDFGSAAAGIKKFSKRIHLLGRCGAFWYNNSDHSIRFAIEMAGQLLGRQRREFDYRAYFGGSYPAVGGPSPGNAGQGA